MIQSKEAALNIPQVDEATKEHLTILTTPASIIPEVTPDLQKLAQCMAMTLETTGGCGLAAPQIGVPKRLIVAKDMRTKQYIAMFNPVITKRSKRMETSREGCLSIAKGKRYYDVQRHRAIEVDFVDVNGKEQTISAAVRLAFIIQHEVDHLNGVLISEKGRLFG
jgi:peptide deformylase